MEALSSCPSKKFDPEFGNTRESVLQVKDTCLSLLIALRNFRSLGSVGGLPNVPFPHAYVNCISVSAGSC